MVGLGWTELDCCCWGRTYTGEKWERFEPQLVDAGAEMPRGSAIRRGAREFYTNYSYIISQTIITLKLYLDTNLTNLREFWGFFVVSSRMREGCSVHHSKCGPSIGKRSSSLQSTEEKRQTPALNRRRAGVWILWLVSDLSGLQ